MVSHQRQMPFTPHLPVQHPHIRPAPWEFAFGGHGWDCVLLGNWFVRQIPGAAFRRMRGFRSFLDDSAQVLHGQEVDSCQNPDSLLLCRFHHPGELDLPFGGLALFLNALLRGLGVKKSEVLQGLGLFLKFVLLICSSNVSLGNIAGNSLGKKALFRVGERGRITPTPTLEAEILASQKCYTYSVCP